MKRKINQRKDQLRLYVFRSNKHIYAQVIDDSKRKTIAASSSLSIKQRNTSEPSGNCKTAAIVGEDIAIKLKTKGITEIIFDRGRKIYHGRIKALADAAREAGIKF